MITDQMKAIRSAVHETVDLLGIEAVKRLSWFPRNRKDPAYKPEGHPNDH